MIAIESGIYTALFTRIGAFAAARVPPIPVAYPGVEFDPPTGAGKMWLEVSVFPNTTLAYAWSNNGPNEYRGFLQVGVVRRPGVGGVKPVLDLAAALIASVPKGAVAGDATITDEGSMASVLIADDRLTVPCTFRYRALSARTI